jgi:hypothetical protein
LILKVFRNEWLLYSGLKKRHETKGSFILNFFQRPTTRGCKKIKELLNMVKTRNVGSDLTTHKGKKERKEGITWECL